MWQRKNGDSPRRCHYRPERGQRRGRPPSRRSAAIRRGLSFVAVPGPPAWILRGRPLETTDDSYPIFPNPGSTLAPVIFPPGRAKLVTSPSLIGSLLIAT